jgi:hypothetical protein
MTIEEVLLKFSKTLNSMADAELATVRAVERVSDALAELERRVEALERVKK